MAEELTLEEAFKDRQVEEYLATARFQRNRDTLADWHSRIEINDEMVRGKMGYTDPAGVRVTSDMLVMNLADQMPRDVARLASEVEPSYSAPAYGDGKKASENAVIRGVVGRGYFEVNDFDVMRPQLIMDLGITGTFFVSCYVGEGDYPTQMRLDPRMCFPTVYNGKLIDLLAVQRVKRRVAADLFPDVDFGTEQGRGGQSMSDEVEIWDYFGSEYCAKAVAPFGDGKTPISGTSVTPVSFWEHGLGEVPVGFGQLPSPDGAFRGYIDQIGPSLSAKNRAVSLLLEYAHEGIYAPFEERGITNSNVKPGPDTVYHHNTNVDGQTFMRRMAPATFDGQLMGLVQYLDQEERGQIGYPATRQGSVGQSQASGSFVSSTMGQLTSLVRESQRILVNAQRDLARMSFALDEVWLDFEKPLHRAIGKKSTYLPSDVIQGHHRLDVIYGAGAGLSREATDTRLLNFFSASLLSGETTLNQTDFIPDAVSEMERRETEELSRTILQRMTQDPSVSLDFINRVWEIKRYSGVPLVEAYSRANAEMAAQPELEAAAAPEAAPMEAGAPPEAAAAAAGAAASLPLEFSPPARSQFLNINRGGGG